MSSWITPRSASKDRFTPTGWRTSAAYSNAQKSIYVSVEPFHLQAYADEQCFRFNERKSSDLERFTLVTMQVADRRITYKELTSPGKRVG